MRESYSNLRNQVIEKLINLGGSKKGDSISYVKSGLVIRHKESGVKYTVDEVVIPEDGKSYVRAYRYYGPDNDKQFFVKITEKDYKKYEPV